MSCLAQEKDGKIPVCLECCWMAGLIEIMRLLWVMFMGIRGWSIMLLILSDSVSIGEDIRGLSVAESWN